MIHVFRSTYSKKDSKITDIQEWVKIDVKTVGTLRLKKQLARKTKQNKTKQNKRKQNKTRQNKTKQNKKQLCKAKKKKKKSYVSKLSRAFVFRCPFDSAKFKV